MDVKDQLILQLVNRVAHLEAQLSQTQPNNVQLVQVEEEQLEEELEEEELEEEESLESRHSVLLPPPTTGMSKSQKKKLN